jgi:hypothetical protein
MKRQGALRLLPVAAGVGAFLCVLAAPARAQQPDFLFRRPWVTLGVSAGYAMPAANSDVFDFTREQFYLLGTRQPVARSDFRSLALQGELTVRATERLDVALDFGWAKDETQSEFQEYIGTDGLPISQTTRFSRVPLTAGVKYYLRDRGRSLGRFAWVPTRWAPYVGAAAGVVHYTFEQQGEFVDYQTLDIFQDFYQSQGWAPTAHVLAGAELTVLPRVALTAEGRYAWAKSELGRDFVDFDDIDLAGFQATAGISFRF